MSAYPEDQSLRELDEAAGAAKGSAFRVFKRLSCELQEGADYRLLHHEIDRAELEDLRRLGRIYRSSVNVVLLSAKAAQRIATALQAIPTAPRKSDR